MEHHQSLVRSVINSKPFGASCGLTFSPSTRAHIRHVDARVSDVHAHIKSASTKPHSCCWNEASMELKNKNTFQVYRFPAVLCSPK